jgi:hypothetical protein
MLLPLVVVALGIALFALAKTSGKEPHDDPDYACEAEIETHDIDDMLDAIDFYRHRSGRRPIAEELADELIRATWS